MNDFDFDSMQKKRIARGAAHRKRGSKSTRCALPSDNMTPAQWKRRNGTVNTYKLNAPMAWSTFKRMPKDLQTDYILNMRERYGANDQMLADMFEVHFSSVCNKRKKLGITEVMPRVSPQLKEERDAKWKAFCEGQLEEPEVETAEPIPAQEETAPAKEAPVEEKAGWVNPLYQLFSPGGIHREEMPLRYSEPAKEPKELGLSYMNAVFTGEFSPEKFMQWIAKLPMPDGNVRIKVEVNRE